MLDIFLIFNYNASPSGINLKINKFMRKKHVGK